MSVIDNMLTAAKKAAQTRKTPAHIVFPEGADPRIVEAALRAARSGVASVTLLGDKSEVVKAIAAAGGKVDEVSILDIQSSDQIGRYAEIYTEIRKGKIASAEKAREVVLEPLNYAALMVYAGDAEATIGGAVYTTSDTVRAALQIIGKAKDASIVSSFFLMGLDAERHGNETTLIFADCALLVDPSVEQLAEIAIASADSYKTMVGEEPRVAMLSFSTKGSARHMAVTKVSDATEAVRQKRPDLLVDGDLQFDAAFIPEIGKSKAPGSAVAGKANVYIFPDLNSGNIGYKIVQRIGGATATGPILQGLAKPANDLSRGCTSEDVFNMILATASQVYASK